MCLLALVISFCFVAAFTYQAGILGVEVKQAVSVAVFDALLRLPAFGENIGSESSVCRLLESAGQSREGRPGEVQRHAPVGAPSKCV